MGQARVLFVIGVVALAGCATQAQRQGANIRDSTVQASNNLKVCIAGVHALPEFQPLKAHIPNIGEQPSLQQLTDKSYASDEEIAAVLVEHPKSQQCIQQFIGALMPTTPTIALIFSQAAKTNEDSLLLVIQKQRTWGEHTTAVRETGQISQAKIVAESQKIDANLSQQHSAEIAQRQAAANAFAQYMQTQAMINAMNRPVVVSSPPTVTNCQTFGNMTNCQTH